MKSPHLETVVPAGALLAESPVWLVNGQRLLWLDIEGKRLHRFDPRHGVDEAFELTDLVGCLAPCQGDRLLLASQRGIEEVRPVDRQLETLRILAHPEEGNPENRYNDGKCSPEGRFWFGSLNMRRRPGCASLYVLDERGCRTVLTGATNSNGLGWSPEGTTFYWIDTPTRRVEAFDYDARDGSLSHRRTVVAFPEDTVEDPAFGRPDGMTVDADGMLWIAHWTGGRVTRWNPRDGTLLRTVFLPVSRVTSVTFGGPELDTLFVTTASKEMTPEERRNEPEAGNLFAFKPGVRGTAASVFSRFAD